MSKCVQPKPVEDDEQALERALLRIALSDQVLSEFDFCIDDPDTVMATLSFFSDVLREGGDAVFLEGSHVRYQGKSLGIRFDYQILAAISRVREELGGAASREALERAILQLLIELIREQCSAALSQDPDFNGCLNGLNQLYEPVAGSAPRTAELSSVEGLEDFSPPELVQNQAWLSEARTALANREGFLALVQFLAEAPRPLSAEELCERMSDPGETMELGDLCTMVDVFVEDAFFRVPFTIIALQNLQGVDYYHLAPAQASGRTKVLKEKPKRSRKKP